jgi:hypothetical protein
VGAKKYVSRPVVVEAIQFTGISSLIEMKSAWGVGTWSHLTTETDPNSLMIDTLEGVMKCNLGDWVIKGTIGEFYPCKDRVFREKYEVSRD